MHELYIVMVLIKNVFYKIGNTKSVYILKCFTKYTFSSIFRKINTIFNTNINTMLI